MYCIGVYDATFGYVETSGFYRASFKIHCSLAFINTIYGCFTLIYEKGGIVYSLFFPNNRFDWSKNWKPETPKLMQELISVVEGITDFTAMNIETIVKDWITKNEIGIGKIMQPFRLSLVGTLKGPHLFDIVEVIGKDETINRIQKAIATL